MSGALPRAAALACLVLLTGCVAQRATVPRAAELNPAQARELIDQSLPKGLADPEGWREDLYQGFVLQDLPVSRDRVCAAVAVIEQESGFKVNPVVPGMAAIAWKEIDVRADRAGVPRLIVHAALELRSADGRRYSERIDAARTEKDLSDIYEDFIAAVPLGPTLFEGLNPVRTRGPMQVNVAFAQQYAAHRPYPYPLQTSLAQELFTRRGSLYFGIAHLFGYQPPYDRYLYRFADFNAGQYASRNAALQNAIGVAAGKRIATDGTLLLPGHDEDGETVRALRSLEQRLDLQDGDISDALAKGRSQALEHTALYERVFALAERIAQHPLPRALVPTIRLQGPKIERTLTTSWYAHRVDGRFAGCMR